MAVPKGSSPYRVVCVTGAVGLVGDATWKWLLSIASHKRAIRTAAQKKVFSVVAAPLVSVLATTEPYEECAASSPQGVQGRFNRDLYRSGTVGASRRAGLALSTFPDGGSRPSPIPELARSIGSVKKAFEDGLPHGDDSEDENRRPKAERPICSVARWRHSVS